MVSEGHRCSLTNRCPVAVLDNRLRTAAKRSECLGISEPDVDDGVLAKVKVAVSQHEQGHLCVRREEAVVDHHPVDLLRRHRVRVPRCLLEAGVVEGLVPDLLTGRRAQQRLPCLTLLTH